MSEATTIKVQECVSCDLHAMDHVRRTCGRWVLQIEGLADMLPDICFPMSTDYVRIHQ